MTGGSFSIAIHWRDPKSMYEVQIRIRTGTGVQRFFFHFPCMFGTCSVHLFYLGAFPVMFPTVFHLFFITFRANLVLSTT